MLRATCTLLCVASLVAACTPSNESTTDSALISASTAVPASTSFAADSTILLGLACELGRTIVQRDLVAFERLIASDHTETTPDGATGDRAGLRAGLESGAVKMSTFAMSGMKVRIYGNAAVLTGQSRMVGTVDKQDVTGMYQWTDTWIRRDGPWQLVASQLTAIQTPPASAPPDQCPAQ